MKYLTILCCLVLVPILQAFGQTNNTEDSAVLAWINMNAIPLKTIEPRDPLFDIQRVNPYLKGKEIVAIGTSVEGSKEMELMRRRLVELLVMQQGFTVIA